jgi:hypothetical protein
MKQSIFIVLLAMSAGTIYGQCPTGNSPWSTALGANIGIGTTCLWPQFKLDVYEDVNPVTLIPTAPWFSATRSNIRQIASVIPGGSYWPYIGLEANANTNFPGQNTMQGVTGSANDGQRNIGGFFGGYSSDYGESNYGVYAQAWGNSTSYGLFAQGNSGSIFNYGVYAQASGNNAWAGWFNGNVMCTGAYFGSDRKLKTDIAPLSGSLDKIMQLKPTTYKFRTNEFPNMNLPVNNQIGLIAQDLEKVFPDLVKDTPEETRIENGNKIQIHPEFKAVQYVQLIPVLIGGIQEQQSTISELNKSVESLKNIITSQQQQINELLAKTEVNTGIADNDEIANVGVDQNQPNPFSEKTKINYTLPASTQNASVLIYDLTGKQITSFPLTEKGTGSLTITADELLPGIYIYNIVADNKIIGSKRMIVSEKK